MRVRGEGDKDNGNEGGIQVLREWVVNFRYLINAREQSQVKNCTGDGGEEKGRLDFGEEEEREGRERRGRG